MLDDPGREIFDGIRWFGARHPSGTAFAFCYGYIRALMDALRTA